MFITSHSAEQSHPAVDVLGSQKWERTDPDLEALTWGLPLPHATGAAALVPRKNQKNECKFSMTLPHPMFWRGKLAAGGRDGFYEEKLEGCREFCG